MSKSVVHGSGCGAGVLCGPWGSGRLGGSLANSTFLCDVVAVGTSESGVLRSSRLARSKRTVFFGDGCSAMAAGRTPGHEELQVMGP